ncbi:Double-stranded RNA-binding protein 1 [Linum perenne]
MTKSVLNELCIKKKWLSPKYTTTKYGPDHIPAFHSTVMVNGTTFASESTARSSKQSKHDVARIAVRELMAAAAAARIENMYKSKLQIYAQKRNLLLPEYDAEQYGPPHVSQFRCSVTVDRQTYWSEGLSPTVKDAEQSAAKVALQALHPEGNEEVRF